jgi:hypothetical protein
MLMQNDDAGSQVRMYIQQLIGSTYTTMSVAVVLRWSLW